MAAQRHTQAGKQATPVQGKLARRLENIASFAPGIAALVFTLVALTVPMLHARAADDVAAPAARQTIRIGSQQPYSFAVYANNDLSHALPVTRAVLLVHGVKRNADDYFGVGLHLMKSAGLPASGTLLMAPNFMVQADEGATSAMPLWGGSTWMQGEDSERGVEGVSSFQALEDMVRWLSDRQRFPQLKEIVMMGHSAGAQLMQRFAVMNDLDAPLRQAGVAIRYIISSPSSYVYFEAHRPDGDGFDLPKSIMCPGYNNYRYGIDNPPEYLARQHLTGEQLFGRYAARNIIYMVGARDNNGNHRYLDKACGAAMQGSNRVERQLNFVRYEQFLSAQWKIPVNHPEFQVPGAAHEADKLLRSEETALKLFPRQ